MSGNGFLVPTSSRQTQVCPTSSRYGGCPSFLTVALPQGPSA
jgi:hypothetical protein